MTEDTYNFFHTYMVSNLAKANSAKAATTVAADGTTIVPVAEEGKLYPESEMRFVLFRHWSLYDAM